MKFLTIIFLALLVTACGKNVNENTPNPNIPKANPGVVTGQPLPIPTTSSGVMFLIFTNHGWSSELEADKYTFFDVNTKITVSFPNVIEQPLDFSFDPRELNDLVSIVVNGDVVCQYDVSPTYNLQIEGSCADVDLDVGDDVSMIGFPRGETIRLKMSYQGF